MQVVFYKAGAARERMLEETVCMSGSVLNHFFAFKWSNVRVNV